MHISNIMYPIWKYTHGGLTPPTPPHAGAAADGSGGEGGIGGGGGQGDPLFMYTHLHIGCRIFKIYLYIYICLYEFTHSFPSCAVVSILCKQSSAKRQAN